MSQTRAVVFNISIQLVGRAVTMLLGLLVVSSLTRYLGVGGFGRYTTVFAYANFFAVIADFGFFNVLVRELSLQEKKRGLIVNNILTLRTLFAGLVFSLGYLIALFLHYPQEVRYGIALISFSLFLLTISLTLIGLFQVEMRMAQAVKADLLGKVVTTLYILVLIQEQASLLYILSAYLLGNLLTLIVTILLSRPYVKLRPAFDYAYYKHIIPGAFSVGIFTILSFLYFHVDMVILSLLKGDFEVGIYGAAYKLIELILVFPGIFSGAIFPLLTRASATDPQQLNRIVQHCFDVLLVVSVPVVFSVILLAEPLITFIAGKVFTISSAPGLYFLGKPATASLILQILVCALVFSFISHLFNTVVLALGKQKRLLLSALLITVLNLGLNYFYIPHYSYLGAAFITILCEILIIIYPLRILSQEKVRLPSFHLLPKILLATILLWGVIRLLLSIWWPFALLGGLLAYTITIYLTGAVSKDVIKELLPRRLLS